MIWRLRYLLQKPLSLNKFICRLKNHPRGVIWYNPGGLEPDMRCRDCGDYLG